jgi:peptidyl-dipeptidase Dcp
MPARLAPWHAALLAALCLVGAPATAAMSAQQALLAPWAGPYDGLPPFDKVRAQALLPALEQAILLHRREVAAITRQTASPSFENTVLPLERSGQALGRVETLIDTWRNSRNLGAMRQASARLAARQTAWQDELTLNRALFQRLEAVASSPDLARLTPEEQRLVQVMHARFVKHGARLDARQQARLASLNRQLAGLYVRFSDNLLAEEEGTVLRVREAGELSGLPEAQRQAAAEAAAQRGWPGEWAFPNTRSAIEPLLNFADARSLRERAFQLFTQRGDRGGAHDNRQTVQRILALRAQCAALLGHPSFAHWQLSDSMAGTPEAAQALMMQLWRPAVAQVQRDVARMQAEVDRSGGHFQIAPWDYRYMAERVRRADLAVDMAEVSRYLALDQVQAAMFSVARRLYGLRFTPVTGVPVFDPAMRVHEVSDASGRSLGLWYFDPCARAGKSSGAWMNAYRPSSRLGAPVRALVSNNANFLPAGPGQPVLLSWDDALTLFHEFGHALHGLLSEVQHPSLSGTATAQDFVEFPSQLHEHWLSLPEVLGQLSDSAGQPMPPDLVARLLRAQRFNKAFDTVEYLASALLDMQVHLDASQGPIEPRAYEQQALARLGMPAEVVMRHRLPQFEHAFGSEDYAASYYSYLWAQVLAFDAFAAFTEAGGPFDAQVADRLRAQVLAVGNAVAPEAAFAAFRGRPPSVTPLLRGLGLLPERASPPASAGSP